LRAVAAACSKGTPAQMISSLGKLAALPEDTKVFCAHEYTLSNLRFARVVEPDNRRCRAREAETDKREHNLPTVPSTIGVEKATNPFLRYREPAIAEQLVKAGKLDRHRAAGGDLHRAARMEERVLSRGR
jgi:hydroxyacylglutathione hydrolase